MATTIRLRPWQRIALDEFRTSAAPDFLAVATPGAGKTTFALTAAAQALANRQAANLIVVTPTQHLKGQWAAAAHRLGLHLDPQWSTREGGISPDMHGIVTTYQQVASSADALAGLSGNAFVIFDEVHHAADDRAWGGSLLRAFEGSSRRLSISGTPFRSDTSAIPFVDYHFDEARPDFEYGYGEALIDGGVVRPVFFPRIGGHMEWVAPDGSEYSADFEDALDAQRSNQRLRAALSLEGEWLPTVLEDAHRQLQTIRERHADAGGLVIATDQEHAQGIAAFIRARLGVAATVAVSDDPSASDQIARFAAGTEPWIVAVRMVSEGVDIPRLRVGVFATTTTTELFFRQAVGRLVRWTRGLRSQKAFLYLPDDNRLRRLAAGIAEERRHSLKKREEAEDFASPEWDDEAPEPADEQPSLFAVISATAAGHVEELPELLADDDGEWFVGEEAGYEIALAVPPPPGAMLVTDEEASGLTRTQLKNRLRDANSVAAAELARHRRSDHRTVNGELNRAVGIQRISEATVEQLRERLAVANQLLRR
jgi:superfamily II DNA or RNA helicase